MTKWKMVPVEPTEHMGEVGQFELYESVDPVLITNPEVVYKAMVAAAPEWWPDDAACELAQIVFEETFHAGCDSLRSWRAAILAAVRGA